MGGIVNSAGGFLGLSGGPQTSAGYNGGMDQLNQMNNGAAQQQGLLNQYAQGGLSANQALNQANTTYAQDPYASLGFSNALATGATTGSKFAADQVAGNQTQNSLYGQQGQLGTVEGKLNDLYNQGYNLTPEDQTMYGQMSGNIARQFGQQGNQAASSLAARGLSNSGAAGATFSGLAGNQNEMLQQAQQQIAQQRYQNTMNQIGQYQNFVGNLGGQYNNALQQQYGRQLSGAQQQGQQEGMAGNMAQGQNALNMGAQEANIKNKPANFMDYASAGMGGLMANPMGMVQGNNPSQPGANTSQATSANNYGAGNYFSGSAPKASGAGPSLFG